MVVAVSCLVVPPSSSMEKRRNPFVGDMILRRSFSFRTSLLLALLFFFFADVLDFDFFGCGDGEESLADSSDELETIFLLFLLLDIIP